MKRNRDGEPRKARGMSRWNCDARRRVDIVRLTSLAMGFMAISASGRFVRSEEGRTELLLRTGEIVHAELVAISQDTFSLKDQRGLIKYSQQELVSWGAIEDPIVGEQVLLADGSLLVGSVASLDSRELILQSTVWGDLEIPRSQVVGIVWQFPPVRSERWSAWDEVRDGPVDFLRLRNGDHLNGVLLSADAREVRYVTGDRSGTLPLESIASWRSSLEVLQESRQFPHRSRAGGVIGLRDGSRLCVKAIKADQRIHLELDSGLVLERSISEIGHENPIVYIRCRHSRVAWLSEMVPTGYKQVSLIGESWPYRFDRNVAGGPLTDQERLMECGIGMHSSSRIAFRWEADFTEFHSEAVIDDASGDQGSVVLRVFTSVDGRQWDETYASQILRGGMSRLPIRVSVRGQRHLALIVEASDQGDVLDRVNWLNARLVD